MGTQACNNTSRRAGTWNLKATSRRTLPFCEIRHHTANEPSYRPIILPQSCQQQHNLSHPHTPKPHLNRNTAITYNNKRRDNYQRSTNLKSRYTSHKTLKTNLTPTHRQIPIRMYNLTRSTMHPRTWTRIRCVFARRTICLLRTSDL